jgi:phosphatidylglycerol:prolipoprotein diacylglycerol transferase
VGNATISFPIFGDFSINPTRYFTIFSHRFYWYGLIIAVGFLLAVMYGLKRAKDFGLTQDDIINMLICAVPTAVVCARAYYVIFNFSQYRDNLSDIFKIWEGGLAIYGGIIGAVIAVVIYCRVKKIKVGAMLDVGALGLFIGQAIGRWGNFINREAYGSSTTLPWRMGLTNSAGTTIYVHPCFLYESLWNILGFVIMHFISKKHRKYDGQIFILYMGWYGLGRMFIESFRTDSLYLFSTNIRVSQLLAGITLLVALVLLFWNKVMHPHDEEELLVYKVNHPNADEENPHLHVITDEELYDSVLPEEQPLPPDDEIVEAPVVEQIDVELHDTDENKSES